MPVVNSPLSEIKTRLEHAQKIAIYAHINPDGDSIGSVLALGWALMDAGKEVQLISANPVPSNLRFLFDFRDGLDPFQKEQSQCDCVILPDISAVDRAIGFDAKRKPDINIDHHISNPGIGVLNWIEPNSPATCCILSDIMPKLGLKITKPVASALLCGVLTDTIAFSTSNVTSNTLRIAANLIDLGAEIYPICRKAVKEHSPEEIRCWQIGMRELHFENGFVWSVLSQADKTAFDVRFNDDAGFANYMANCSGANVSVLFMERGETETKVSWRSVPGFDVSKIAVHYGGGGHAAAAGATIQGKLDDVIRDVLNVTKQMYFGD